MDATSVNTFPGSSHMPRMSAAIDAIIVAVVGKIRNTTSDIVAIETTTAKSAARMRHQPGTFILMMRER